MAIVFDIETMPKPDEELQKLAPEPKLPNRPGPFMEVDVKVGNLGPGKAKEKIEKARKEHAQKVANHSQECKQAKQEQFELFKADAALSPKTGEVLCIGCCSTDTLKTHVIERTNNLEVTVLREFWALYRECESKNVRMAGLNIFRFDLPFLIKRSWAIDLDVPPTVLNVYDKWCSFNPIFVDLRNVWQMGDRQCKSSFDEIGAVLRTGGKAMGNGKAFHLLWEKQRDAAMKYLINDVRQPAEWCRRVGIK